MLIRVPEIDYHAKSGVQYLSAHKLQDVRLHGIEALLSQKDDEETPDAFRIGSLAHKLILEGPGEFSESVVVGGPMNMKTGKPYGGGTKVFLEWASTLPEGVLGCTSAEYEQLYAMRGAVLAHGGAARLLSSGQPELVARCVYDGLHCQGRLDWVTDSGEIVDLKTCRSVVEFSSDADRYGYLFQMAFYGALLSTACETPWPDIYMIAVEKHGERPNVAVWKLDEYRLHECRADNEARMEEIRSYLERNPECQQANLLAR